MENRYDEKITRRLFFSMVPIQILMVMCGGVNVIIDSAFASNLIGPQAMAVTGLYWPLCKVLDTVNAMIFCGAQLMCGKYLGENTVKRARGVFTLDMLLITVFGIIASLMFGFCPAVAAIVCTGPSNPLFSGLLSYLKGLSTGVVPFLLGTQLTSFLQLEKKEKLGYIGIAGMFISNSACDYIFIKILNLDIYGLGLATSVSNWVYFLILLICFMGGKVTFKISFKDLDFRELPYVIKNGLPAAGTQFMQVLRGYILNNLILNLAGSAGLEAFTAVCSFGYVYWAVPEGVSSAFINLASVYTGEKDKTAIELLLKIFLKRALPQVIGVSLILSCLAYPMTNIYFHDPASAAYQMAFLGFILFPLSSPVSTFIVGIRDLWRCMDFQLAVTVNVIADGFLGVVAMSFIFGGLFGMTGIWLAQLAGGWFTVLLMFILAWIREKKAPFSYPVLCCYPKNFGVDEDHRLSISVHSMEEVVNISQKVMDFCDKQGVDRKTSFRAGLCVEEMAGNIVKHGFTGKANSVIDICVVKTDEELIIKMKDNCKLFNPQDIDDIFVPEDPVKNIGVRVVRKVCKSMDYYPLLGLNVLTIKM